MGVATAKQHKIKYQYTLAGEGHFYRLTPHSKSMISPDS
jgi:hypothetical protein